MVQFRFSDRLVNLKVVYYGPALSGKTTNLECLHRLTDPHGQNRLISLNTTQDRTLFFDLLPLELGRVSGFEFRVQVYTVPGQVRYNATRRVVLAGADGVVFVADSRRACLAENLASVENMRVNLVANSLDPRTFPLVYQFNKQDLPDLQAEAALNRSLNPEGRRAFKAVATRGDGVVETLVAVLEQVLTKVAVEHHLDQRGLAPRLVQQLVAEAFAHLVRPQVIPPDQAPGRLVVAPLKEPPQPTVAGGTDPHLLTEDLLAGAIRSTGELAEKLALVVREVRLAATQIGASLAGPAADMVAIQQQADRLLAVVSEIDGQPAMPNSCAGGVESVEESLRLGVEAARGATDFRGLRVALDVAPALARPRCASATIRQAVAALLEGISDGSPPASTAEIHADRRSVVIKHPQGDVRSDFLVIAAKHGLIFSEQERSRILRGAEQGSMGEASRLVRKAGGFLRFEALGGEHQETRIFLPL
jgi:signal recognition particle receptor subunit beta